MMKFLLYLFFIVTCYNTFAQADQVSSAVNTFMSARTYSEKKAALNIKPDQTIVNSIAYLIEHSPHLFFQQRLFYFLGEMKEKGELNDQEYILTLSHMVNNPLLGDKVLDRLESYISDESSLALMGIDSSVLSQPHVEMFFLSSHLNKNICNDFVVSTITKAVKSYTIDIRDRRKLLESFLNSCRAHKNFRVISFSLIEEKDLEWPLKEKVFLSDPYFVCAGMSHLFSLFFENQRLHIRDDIVWVLADIDKDCDQDHVVSFFIELIERDPDQMSADLLEFRETMIRSPLWALVRIGIKNQNVNVITNLKAIAMNYNFSPYFRARAVEALQDLSIYFGPAAHSLYEIVRDNKRVATSSGFVTEVQRIREEEDAQIRYSAFVALEEILGFDRREGAVVVTRRSFLPFLYPGYEERPDSDEIYRQRAFAGLQVPHLLDAYAHPVMAGLVNDQGVEEYYRTEAAALLQRLP